MLKTIIRNLSILLFCIVGTALSAQVTNDECDTALPIANVNGCSDIAGYTLQGATASGFGPASCAGSVNGDIWFTFVAEFTSITVVARGATQDMPGGTLRNPSVSLYVGDCNGTINELQCGTDQNNSHVAEVTQHGLFVGQTYLIRVDSRSANSIGSFQLCLSNFNLPAYPGSDCSSAAFLCDKSSFTVESVTGAGLDRSEMDGATCFTPAITNLEMNSTWFTWVAGNDGTLEFTLTPLNITDDLDFVVYELPNGKDNCSGKAQLRCMASGFSSAEAPCDGPTGLRSGSVDGQELPGCTDGSDNFVAPIDMIAGRAYALVVNNFTSEGNGFQIDFGGTGEFRGPEPNFTMTPSGSDACLGSQITFNDASTYADGNITSWAWTFGTDSDLQTALGDGPHTVTYSSPGVKQIVLTVETDQGCIITDIQEVVIDPCCQSLNAITQTSVVNDANCWDTNEGGISFAVSSNQGPHQYFWDNGSNITTRDQLFPGDYLVTVTSQFCDTVYNFTVGSPPPIEVDTIFVIPDCRATNGSITLNPQGGTPGYEYKWNNSPTFSSDNFLNNIGQGVYPVVIRDIIGCDDTLSIPLNELQLELVDDDNVTIPTCNGFSDGGIILDVNNGTGPYMYNFDDSRGFTNSNFRDDLPAGLYQITITDNNLCEGLFDIEILDHPPVTLNIDKMDISCFGENDGSAMATLDGGVGNYNYFWSNGSSNPDLTNLTPGDYTLDGQDGNACSISQTITIVEPGPIGVQIDNVVDVICFGDESGSIAVSSIGGSGDFTYSIDGNQFMSSTIFERLAAGDYVVTIRDINNCTSTSDATIMQPPELLVNAGDDQEINFGFDTNISTTYTPATQIVSYEWFPNGGLDCMDCPDIRVQPFVTTDYVVEITDQTNCIARDTIRIVVNDIRPIYAPNVFTPNQDGTNDRFNIYSNIAGVGIEMLQIYDRWGGLIYEEENLPLNDPTVGWDGTFKGQALNVGVYVYYAEIRFLDNEVRGYSGDIALMR